MPKTSEANIYLENKKEIFLQLIDAIDTAHSTRKRKIYLKGIKVLEEEVDVVASKDNWLSILQKAIAFFESTEDYEMCQRCQNLKDSIDKKKQNVNAKSTTTKRNKEI